MSNYIAPVFIVLCVLSVILLAFGINVWNHDRFEYEPETRPVHEQTWHRQEAERILQEQYDRTYPLD